MSLNSRQWDIIREIAEDFRASCGGAKACLSGFCIPCTEALTQELQRHYIPAHHVYGVVWVDGGFEDYWGSSNISWAPAREYDDWLDHHFVWIDGWVVDITGDQFNPLIRNPQEKIPSVLIARWEDLPRYQWTDDGPIFYSSERGYYSPDEGF